jgi:hypothetical protein
MCTSKDPAIPLLGVYILYRNENICPPRSMYRDIHSSIFHSLNLKITHVSINGRLSCICNWLSCNKKEEAAAYDNMNKCSKQNIEWRIQTHFYRKDIRPQRFCMIQFVWISKTELLCWWNCRILTFGGSLHGPVRASTVLTTFHYLIWMVVTQECLYHNLSLIHSILTSVLFCNYFLFIIFCGAGDQFWNFTMLDK